MAQIATTAHATPVNVPGYIQIDTEFQTGRLWVMVRTGATEVRLYRSVDGGANWTLQNTVTRANLEEVGPIFVDYAGIIHWCYRVNESSQDRVYYRRYKPSTNTWQEVLLAAPGNGGVAGAVYTGLALTAKGSGAGFLDSTVLVVVGHKTATQLGVSLLCAKVVNATGSVTAAHGLLLGQRLRLQTGTPGRIVPVVDTHSGRGKTGVNDVWVAWGRGRLGMLKLIWNGNGWNVPAFESTLLGTKVVTDYNSCLFDGDRFIVATLDTDSLDQVTWFERSKANTTTIERETPVHPQGNIRHFAVTHNWSNKNLRIYAIGTSGNRLYYIDWVRSSDTFTSWTELVATDILGLGFSVHRGILPSYKFDVLYAISGAPNQIHHNRAAVSLPPTAPLWNQGLSPGETPGVQNGAAADVSSPLQLDWKFSDPDPADTQSAYALSRQIGAGTIAYFRASDSTWQPAEVKNASATTNRQLAASWGTGADLPHTYKVKVWDSTDIASAYSNALIVIASGKVNPTITSPTEAQVIGTGTVTITWTVAEQTAFRVRIQVFASTVFDSGWVTGTELTYTPNHLLGHQFSYSIFLSTRNNEGLASDEIQRNFSVEFVSPPTATIAMTPQPALGTIRVVATNPAPVGAEPAVGTQNLYRRPARFPYIVNHTFETADMSGWGAETAGVAVRSNAQAHQGSWSYQFTPTGAIAEGFVETVKLPCNPGDEFFLDMWIRGVSVSRKVLARIRWYTAGDVFIENRDGLSDEPPASGAWGFRWVRGTAPATAAKMTLCGVITDTPGAGDLMHVDEVRLSLVDDTPGVPVASGLGTNFTYDDWTALSGVDYEYRCETIAVTGVAVGGVWTR